MPIVVQYEDTGILDNAAAAGQFAAMQQQQSLALRQAADLRAAQAQRENSALARREQNLRYGRYDDDRELRRDLGTDRLTLQEMKDRALAERQEVEGKLRQKLQEEKLKTSLTQTREKIEAAKEMLGIREEGLDTRFWLGEQQQNERQEDRQTFQAGRQEDQQTFDADQLRKRLEAAGAEAKGRDPQEEALKTEARAADRELQAAEKAWSAAVTSAERAEAQAWIQGALGTVNDKFGSLAAYQRSKAQPAPAPAPAPTPRPPNPLAIPPATQPAPPPATQPAGLPVVRTDADYQGLPSGAEFVDEQGKRYRKR